MCVSALFVGDAFEAPTCSVPLMLNLKGHAMLRHQVANMQLGNKLKKLIEMSFSIASP